MGLLPEDSDDHLIKRVVGLPGDHVVCAPDGTVTINGTAIDEPYVSSTSQGEPMCDVTVPSGNLWVMGDNRARSADSRYNQDKPHDGFVPLDLVVGRAYAIVWPVSHWAWLSTPSDFDQVSGEAGIS